MKSQATKKKIATKNKEIISEVEDSQPTAPADQPIPQADFEQTPVEKQNELNYKQVYFDMDDEQEKVNYKPFFITFFIIIIVAVGGYFAWTLYLKDSGLLSKLPFFKSDQTVEQPAVTDKPVESNQPEQEPIPPSDEPPQLTPAEQQKLNFLSKLAGKTNKDINSIANVISVSRKSTKLSSVLLYDPDFIIEVFGKSQNDLANLNSALKKAGGINNLKMVSTNERIGANSGVIGVFSAKLASAGSASKQVTLNLSGSTAAGNWIKDIFKNNKLTVTSFKNRSTKNQDVFKVYEIETTAKGSINSCLNALNAIAAAGTNVKLHKLTCSAIDQTNFSTANYQLKLVVKVYV
ncbi:MAG: hypothetical protein P8Y99_04920 [Calditrichaceae bacterium]